MKHVFAFIACLIMSGAAWAKDVAVDIKTHAYVPASITVAPGTTVNWTNRDQDPHTVTEKDKQFHSAALDTGDHYSYTFKTPGTYHYSCTLHPTMLGTVVVKEGK